MDLCWTAVDREFVVELGMSDGTLDRALAASAAAGLPEIQVTPSHGKQLMLLAKAIAARRVLEIGTLGGYSTIWLARGLAPGGRLVTLELEERHAAVARANLAEAGFGDTVEVIVGQALETLPTLASRGVEPFDLVFIDANKDASAAYFDWAVRLARPGAVIIVDNVIREGAVLERESTDPRVLGIRRLVAQLGAELGADPRVEATIIQTVGEKGHDGYLLAVVRQRT